MRVIDPKEFSKAKLQAHESFFVELWYSMAHAQSLDSYRVKCMNAKTISRELSQELHIGLLLKKEQTTEFASLCCEVEKLLTGDPVCSQAYPVHLRNITPLLKKFNQSASKDDKDRKKDLTELKFAIDDLLADMDRTYFRALCDLLKTVVEKAELEEIRRVTAALLSDLVDQGWDLDSLYRWHRHLLAHGKSASYTFSKNLNFMLSKLQRGPQSFEVILRLSGSPRLKEVCEFGSFTISESSPAKPDGDAGTHFGKEHELTCFARKEVEALDFLPAAISARQAFETQLDLLRFDYERRVVNIEDTCYVNRVGDSKSKLVTVQMGVPNPVETIDQDGLESFVTTVDEVCNNKSIEASSRAQLEAAIRQYRFGRDNTSYRDMFLNWWMGLEALTRIDGGGSIGTTVTNNTSKVLSVEYFSRLLRDLQVTLKHCKIQWPQELADFADCPTVNDLTISQLLLILQTEEKATLLKKQCHPNPTLAYRTDWIGDWLRDSKKALQRYDSHLKNVEWQVQRLYRIRCCIVHGSPIRHRLGLYTANLEFYLKQTILFTLKSFHNNDQIKSLDDLYSRTAITSDRIVKSLNEENASPEIIREAVFAGAVTRERSFK